MQEEKRLLHARTVHFPQALRNFSRRWVALAQASSGWRRLVRQPGGMRQRRHHLHWIRQRVGKARSGIWMRNLCGR